MSDQLIVQFSSFVGVEVCRERSHPFTYAVIDRERVIRSLGSGDLKDAFAFLAGQENALIAINAPRQPQSGERAAEAELLRRGVEIERTPGSLKRCPRWMRRGFRLYEELGKLSYEPYPRPNTTRQFFESRGEAAFWNLLGHEPLKQDSLEGRIQRQLVLGLCGLPVPDAMLFFEEITRHRLLHNLLPLDELYSSAELNTLAAAHTAWAAGNQPESLESIGNATDGLIYLPGQAVVNSL